jgi:dephospho-CoA kinase
VIVGVTGSFGTGKTFVASVFRTLGAKVIDADKLAHKALREGTPAYKKILKIFGKSIAGKDRKISRRKLAGIVFGNRHKLEILNRIIHPIVIKEAKETARMARPDSIVVIDAPLLIEAGLAGDVDKLVVVKAARERQIARCRKKFRLSEEDVLRRMENQIPLEKKLAMADFVIDNDGLRNETKRQVRRIWEKLLDKN